MKIAIDITPLHSYDNRFRGLGSYIRNLIEGILALKNNHSFLLITKRDAGCDNLNAWLDDLKQKYNGRLKFETLSKENTREMKLQKLFYKTLNKERIDLLHVPVQLGLPWLRSFKTVVTIHDLVHCKFPDVYLADIGMRSKLYFYTKLFLTSKANRFIAISENTKEDIMRYLRVPENHIRVIYNGISSKFKPLRENYLFGEMRIKFGVPCKFIMYVGGVDERKNIMRIIQAFNNVIRNGFGDVSLLIVGKINEEGQALFDRIQDRLLFRNVIVTGFVEEDELVSLYNACEFLIFPSIYEGFGLPPLEAMACGKTLISSNTSSLPEVAGDAALYVNPYSVDEISHGIAELLSNNSLRSKLESKALGRARQFSWENTACETLNLYEEVAKS